MKAYIIILSSFLLIFSCSKDNDSNTPDPTSSETIRVEGKVVNENNEPLSGAIVSSGNKTATTTSTGTFVLDGVPFAERSFVKVVSSGSFDSYFGFMAKAGKTSFVEVTTVSKGAPTTFNGASGKTLSNQGGSVEISPNSIVDASGKAYSGSITAYLKFMSPDQDNFGQMMPGGDFIGENASAQTGVLTSYGYYSIELEDAAGKELNIKKGNSADFSMPISASQMATAPSTVKLWSFDETKGIWKEEGSATKTGSNYVGKVGHFSSWNADDWSNIATIKGTVKCNGLGVSNAAIKLYNGSTAMYAYSNSEGYYEVRVPAGNSIQITLPGLGPENLGVLTPNQTIEKNSTVACGTTADLGIITAPITDITARTAVSGGTIPNSTTSLLDIYERGVCWAVTPNPTVSGSKTSDGSGSGSFVSNMSNLSSNTLYYVRAYATGGFGTKYGNQLTFTTLQNTVNNNVFNPNLTYGSMSDIDGNTYKTIQIGTQTWMAENLKTSKYRNGDAITTDLNDTAWGSTNSGAYSILEDDAANNDTYGKLYNWYAVTDSRKLCPAGWHVPSDVEWTTLENFLGGSEIAGVKMKSVSSLWQLDTVATNESGFSGLPGGNRTVNFGYSIRDSYWWSSTEYSSLDAWDRLIFARWTIINRSPIPKAIGESVRCLKD